MYDDIVLAKKGRSMKEKKTIQRDNVLIEDEFMAVGQYYCVA